MMSSEKIHVVYYCSVTPGCVINFVSHSIVLNVMTSLSYHFNRFTYCLILSINFYNRYSLKNSFNSLEGLTRKTEKDFCFLY